MTISWTPEKTKASKALYTARFSNPAHTIMARTKRLKGAIDALKYLAEEELEDAATIAFLKDLREELEDAVDLLEGELEDHCKPNIPWEQVKAKPQAEHPKEGKGDV